MESLRGMWLFLALLGSPCGGFFALKKEWPREMNRLYNPFFSSAPADVSFVFAA